jgi:hypothetical protein
MVGLRESVSVPIAHVQRFGDVLTVNSHDAVGGEGDSETTDTHIGRLDNRFAGFDPVAVHSHHGYKSDVQQVSELLEQVFQSVDLLEPFERITTDLVTLAERD